MSQYNFYRSGRDRQGARPYNNRPNRGPKKAYIHPSKFIQTAKSSTQEEYVPKNSFEDFDLTPLLHANLRDMQFSIPSAIQDQAIPHALEGRDIVGIADTGTGKTAAFAVPLLNSLILNPKNKAIILAPTRELAQQIDGACRDIAKGSGLDGALLIGGEQMGPQLRDLRYNPRIIIGTPGRIKDHIERGSLNLSDCNLIVLDEVDRMLDMGFVNDITYILSQASEQRQSFYFSATVDSKVKNIIESFSKDTVHISVKSGDSSDNVEQNIVTYTSPNTKIDMLHSILNDDGTAKAIIFDDTHRSVEKLSKELVARGFSTDAIHGGKSQSQRQRVLNKFKTNKINILVATDVAARGLDVSDITHVINFSLPQSYDDYVHRIGRTGRAGKVGYALTFVEK